MTEIKQSIVAILTKEYPPNAAEPLNKLDQLATIERVASQVEGLFNARTERLEALLDSASKQLNAKPLQWQDMLQRLHGVER